MAESYLNQGLLDGWVDAHSAPHMAVGDRDVFRRAPVLSLSDRDFG
jgi:hypothetical protein